MDVQDNNHFFNVGKSDDSAITASPSSPLSVTPGGNMSFQCEFHVGDKDKVVYDGITVGIWERGGILLSLLTLTKNETLIMNPKLDQEVPAYHGRVFAKTWSNRTTNTSVMTIEINNIRESDRTCYGCSMYFGPFRGLLGAAVRLDIQGMWYLVISLSIFKSSRKNFVPDSWRV